MLLLAGVLFLSLCACADQPVAPPVTPAPTESPVATPEPKKELSLAYDPEADLDPITTSSPVNRMLITLIYEGLFALDEELIPYPVLAESAECNGSATVWTIAVKEGLVFSDGTPLELSHVADSLNRARKSGFYASRLKDVTSVRVKDGKIVISLSAGNGSFPTLLDIPIVLEREGEPAPLGTGRYRYAQSESGTYLLTNYNREGKPPYESIGLCPAVGTSGRISAFNSGGAGIMLTDFTSPYAPGYSCDYEQWDYSTTDLLYVGFKCVESPCGEPLVRQAFAQTFDRSALVSGPLAGYGDPVALPLPEGHSDWYGEAAEVLAYNPAEAAEGLAAAGYIKKEDGLLYRDKEPLAVTLVVNSDNPGKVAAAELLAEGLADLGVTVTVKKLLWQDYLTALTAGDFDLYLGEVRMTADFDITELIGGSLNYGRHDPVMLTELIAARKGAVGEARPMACRNLWNIYVMEVPVAPLCFMRESMLVRWEARLVPTPQYHDPFFGLESW